MKGAVKMYAGGAGDRVKILKDRVKVLKTDDSVTKNTRNTRMCGLNKEIRMYSAIKMLLEKLPEGVSFSEQEAEILERICLGERDSGKPEKHGLDAKTAGHSQDAELEMMGKAIQLREMMAAEKLEPLSFMQR